MVVYSHNCTLSGNEKEWGGWKQADILSLQLLTAT